MPGGASKLLLRKSVYMEMPVNLQGAYANGPMPVHTLKLSGGKRVTWQAFNVMKGLTNEERDQLWAEISAMISDGSLPSDGAVDVVQGSLADVPGAFRRMLAGDNVGKQLVELLFRRASSAPPWPRHRRRVQDES